MQSYSNLQKTLKNLLIKVVFKKDNSSYKTIAEVLEILNSNNTSQKKIELHTIRFWETQFKQLSPKRANNRRYYDNKNIDILLKIQFFLKNQGMTINGVKKILDNNDLNIDLNKNKNINATSIKIRLNKINKLLKNLKQTNGKKISHKSKTSTRNKN